VCFVSNGDEKGQIKRKQTLLLFEKLIRYGRYSKDIIQDVKKNDDHHSL